MESTGTKTETETGTGTVNLPPRIKEFRHTKFYGVIIACRYYDKHGEYENLPRTHEDAKLAHKMLSGFSTKPEDIFVLYDPDWKTISALMGKIRTEIAGSDEIFTVFFYYSGHGETIDGHVAIVLNEAAGAPKYYYPIEAMLLSIASTP